MLRGCSLGWACGHIKDFVYPYCHIKENALYSTLVGEICPTHTCLENTATSLSALASLQRFSKSLQRGSKLLKMDITFDQSEYTDKSWVNYTKHVTQGHVRTCIRMYVRSDHVHACAIVHVHASCSDHTPRHKWSQVVLLRLQQSFRWQGILSNR